MSPTPMQLSQRRQVFRCALMDRVRPVHDAFVLELGDIPPRPPSLSPSDNWDMRFDLESCPPIAPADLPERPPEVAARREAEHAASVEGQAELRLAGQGKSLAVQRALEMLPDVAPHGEKRDEEVLGKEGHRGNSTVGEEGAKAKAEPLVIPKELRGLSPALLAKVAARQARNEAKRAQSSGSVVGVSTGSKVGEGVGVTTKTIAMLEMIRAVFKLRGKSRNRLPMGALERELLAVHRDSSASAKEVRGQISVLLREAPELCSTILDPIDGSHIFKFSLAADFPAVRARLQQRSI